MKSFKEYIQEQGGRRRPINPRPRGNHGGSSWIDDLFNLSPGKPRTPIGPGIRGRRNLGVNDQRLPKLPDNLDPDDADSIASFIEDSLADIAQHYFNTLGTLFPDLMALHPDAFEAFRVMIRKMMSWPSNLPMDPMLADTLLDYLFDMDVALSWDLESGVLSFNHTNPAINQSLQTYMMDFLGIIPGNAGDNSLIDLMIEILDSGDSMYG
tara:strand:- start:974 stop:1603 length:630 start_codon:yes stop_codon:yes gene_type:complete